MGITSVPLMYCTVYIEIENMQNFQQYKNPNLKLFNVDYRPGSKNSKFDMVLIRHSPFKPEGSS